VRKYLLVLLLLPNLSLAESSDPWFAFWDKTTELKGFKDKDGKIQIIPKFVGLTSAIKFRDIIAVMEEKDGNYTSYYLLKDGKRVGVNDTYVSDMAFDCESESMIRFRDHSNEKVGFLDSDGHIAIPALYSDASAFRNGMAVALKDAKRICWEGGEYTKANECEHWQWKGGKTTLINKMGKVLVDNFDLKRKIDWFSLSISDSASEDDKIVSFKAVNEKYYNFNDTMKVFEYWLNSYFMVNPTKRKLVENTFSEITYWSDKDGWIADTNTLFIERNFEILNKELSWVKQTKDYSILVDGLNQFIFNSELYQKYYDDCGNANTWQYPVLSLLVNHKTKNDDYQNAFDFLKTDSGYKLISITIRKEKLIGTAGR